MISLASTEAYDLRTHAEQVYLAFAIPGLLAAPILRRAFPKLLDGGASLGRPFGWLLIAWLAWILPSVGLAPYGQRLVWTSAGLLAVSGLSLYWIDRAEWKRILREQWKTILLGEAIALLVFLVFTWDVQWNGDIHPSAERFMDYAILERIGLTKVFPPMDAWMAGKTLQYYYYGYVLMDVLRRLSGLDLRWFFNLAIPGVYSAFALTLYGGGLSLMRTRRGAAVAVLFGAIFGNFDFVRQILVSRWVSGRWIFYPMDWFHASRVINGTINETPAFSVFWGDLHPYFIAFPLAALCAAMAISIARDDRPAFDPSRGNDRLITLAALTISLGSLFPANSWDLPTFMTVVLSAIAWTLLPTPRSKTIGRLLAGASWEDAATHHLSAKSVGSRLREEWNGWAKRLVIACATVAIASIVLYLPFHIGFGKQVGRGVRLAQHRSDALDMLVHFGPWFAIILGWGLASSRNSEARRIRVFTLPAVVAVLAFYELAVVPHISGTITRWEAGSGLFHVVASGLDHLLLRGVAFILLIAALWTLLGDLEVDDVLEREGVARVLACAGVGLVLVVEFVFVRDFYGGENERMNTVFKVYIQAWILLALGCAGLYFEIWRALEKKSMRWKTGFVAASALLAVCGSSFLLLADYTRSSRFHGTRTISFRGTWDAEKLFRETYRADAIAVDWIRANLPPDATLLEMTAHAYEWPSRVSTFSGRCSLVGWKNHESGWRNSWDLAQDRDRVIEEVYSTPDPSIALKRLHEYGIEYVYVGELEHNHGLKPGEKPYDLKKFEGWPVEYSSGDGRVILYRVPPAGAPGA